MNTLEQKELWQKGDVKAYYSELTDIARNYIEEAIAIPAMESTTAELVAGLKAASQKKKMKLSQETIENLERVLKQADLVKFAKWDALPDEHELSLYNAFLFVNQTKIEPPKDIDELKEELEESK